MRSRPLLPLLKWPLALILFAGLCAAAYVVHNLAREERNKEADAVAVPRRVLNATVKLGAKLAATFSTA